MMTTIEFLGDSLSLHLIFIDNDMTIVVTYLQVPDKNSVSTEI